MQIKRAEATASLSGLDFCGGNVFFKFIYLACPIVCPLFLFPSLL